jgi:hypothetical protein
MKDKSTLGFKSSARSTKEIRVQQDFFGSEAAQ